jgi:hypothetical protein
MPARELVAELLRAGFPVKEAAEAGGVTPRWARMVAQQEGIAVARSDLPSNAPPRDILDKMVGDIVRTHGHDYGRKMLLGALRAAHPQYIFSRSMVQESMARLFPAAASARRQVPLEPFVVNGLSGSVLAAHPTSFIPRARATADCPHTARSSRLAPETRPVSRRRYWTRRRIMRGHYSAPHFMYSVHLDLNGKLQEYGLFIGAVVDGDSRIVLRLTALTNKLAATVYEEVSPRPATHACRTLDVRPRLAGRPCPLQLLISALLPPTATCPRNPGVHAGRAHVRPPGPDTHGQGHGDGGARLRVPPPQHPGGPLRCAAAAGASLHPFDSQRESSPKRAAYLALPLFPTSPAHTHQSLLNSSPLPRLRCESRSSTVRSTCVW